MTIRGEIRYRGHPDALKKELIPATKEEGVFVIRDWHTEYLPKHFTFEAHGRYNIRHRGAAYNKRKQRIHGHQNPLQYSGELKMAVSMSIRAKSTNKPGEGVVRFTGIMDGPHYLHKYRGAGTSMADELVAVTRSEVTSLAHRLDKGVTKKLNAVRSLKIKKF